MAEDIDRFWVIRTDDITYQRYKFPLILVEGYDLILKNIPNFIEDLERLQKLINKEEG